jgi:hypothetical protein
VHSEAAAGNLLGTAELLPGGVYNGGLGAYGSVGDTIVYSVPGLSSGAPVHLTVGFGISGYAWSTGSGGTAGGIGPGVTGHLFLEMGNAAFVAGLGDSVDSPWLVGTPGPTNLNFTLGKAQTYDLVVQNDVPTPWFYSLDTVVRGSFQYHEFARFTGNVWFAPILNPGGSGLGTIVASSGFSYAQPTPEPETYAMMLAGLGVIGFVVRRRSSGRA